MLPNEEFALACRAYYEEQGLIVDATNGQFAHCPLPRDECDTGYYLLWEHHQQQGLLQSRDVGRCCFWVGHAKQWLCNADYFPDNYFELWDIYDFFKSWGTSVTHMHTPEAISKRALTQKNQKMGKAPTQMNKARKKPVEIEFPDGTKEIFPSVKEAAEGIGGKIEMVSQWARKGWKIKTKKFKGYSARFL